MIVARLTKRIGPKQPAAARMIGRQRGIPTDFIHHTHGYSLLAEVERDRHRPRPRVAKRSGTTLHEAGLAVKRTAL
jgi:hypothetical protein